MQFIKWTSLFVIFILSTLIGNKIASKYKNRVRELNDLKTILNTIQIKIKFTQEPLVDIFKEIYEEESVDSIKKLFKCVSENLEKMSMENAWKKSIEQNKDKFNLNKEDLSILERIGNNLGKTDIDGQMKEIEVTKEFIDIQLEKAEEDRKKNEKIYKTLGGIAGIGIVIILI